MMTRDRIYHLSRRLADARERASMARQSGDDAGYRYCAAEARKLARVLAEG
jgi:hypothetical protein